jgi:ATP-dependent DNA ligase
MSTPFLPHALPPLAALQAMESLPAAEAFCDPDWVFELSAGGPRALADCDACGVCLHSRRHRDITRWFPEVCADLASLEGGRLVLDGELCVPGPGGMHDAGRLQARTLEPQRIPELPACFVVFDILVWYGDDVRPRPWWQRRSLLQQLPLQGLAHVALQRVHAGEGVWLHRQAQAVGRRVMAKRRNAPYRGGRCSDWLAIA